MTWLAAFFSSAWSRVAALAAVLGAGLLLLARIFRAGRDAARADAADAALRHKSRTEDEVRKSDDAISDPESARARRIRRQFERPD